MKKYLLALVLGLLVLSGCKDAVAKVSNPKETLITIGNQKITKEEVYEVLNRQDGFSTIFTDIRNVILEKEVEVTDEIRTAAEAKLEAEKKEYGDDFADYLEVNGYATEDDYLNQYLIPAEKVSHLAESYIDENWEKVITAYYPTQVQIIECDSLEKIKEAQHKLTDGEKFEDVAAAYTLKSDELFDGKTHTVSAADSSKLTSYITDFLKSATKEGVSEVIENSSGSKFYLVNIVSRDVLSYKKAAVDSIKKSSDITSEMYSHYYKKYGFRTYDISLYNYMKQYYPTYLNQ